MHISKAVLLTTTTLTLATALPSTHTTKSNPPNQEPDRARAQQLRQERLLAAFAAQKPLHTSALLAGAAAATPPAQKRHSNLRVRDLRTVTGEDGLWVSLEDIVAREADDRPRLDEGQEEEYEQNEDEADESQIYKKRVEEQVVFIERREGWDRDGKRKGKGKGKGNGAGEI